MGLVNGMTYEEYRVEAFNMCDSPEQPWNQTSTQGQSPTRLVPIVNIYPPLNAETVNTWKSDMIAQESSEAWREYLSRALDDNRIWQFSGYKSLEIAQQIYHARLNTLFDCAVIESRIAIIMGLQESNAIRGQSEIIASLSREMQRLSVQRRQCLPEETTWADSTTPSLVLRRISERIVNTATLQYCHYTQFISYLDAELNNNITPTLQTEMQIGAGDDRALPSNSDILSQTLIQRQSQIKNELIRAERALPRAILGFKEMQKTYAAHLLLTIIYDDYVRLRDNLHRYLSPVSQLFEKAYNAMSP